MSQICLLGFDINDSRFRKMTDRQLLNFLSIVNVINDSQAENKKQFISEITESIRQIGEFRE